MNNLSNISERLSELMTENIISNTALATAMGVSLACVNHWREKSSGIYLSNALNLCEFFNCSLNYLFSYTDKKLDFTPHYTPLFYDSLMKCLQHRKITCYRLIKDTRFSEGNLYSFKLGRNPHTASLIDLAIYLNVTLDQLVGRESLLLLVY